MNAEDYRKNWSTGGVHSKRPPVIVPEDVVRVSVSEPCFLCGMARGLCRHRRSA